MGTRWKHTHTRTRAREREQGGKDSTNRVYRYIHPFPVVLLTEYDDPVIRLGWRVDDGSSKAAGRRIAGRQSAGGDIERGIM